MSDKIKVAIRVRPLIERERLDNAPVRWIPKDNQIHQVDPASGKPKGDCYTFDHIFTPLESNGQVFDTVIKPIIDASMHGFNGTVFAYGQTSSGKTYTMSGSNKCLGIIPLAINYIFYSIENTPGREFLLRVSYMEIYNEKVNDLLDLRKKNLKVQEDTNGQVVVDVEERVCKNSEEVLDEKYKGDKNRRVGETNMNERSSRSHTIFRIILESRTTDDEEGAVKVSHLNFVDLAGSERSGQSGATGDRFKEGCHINMSLTTLGIVINQLSDGPEGQFVNFRDSKLTRLLQSSIGGNAMTAIICAITPAADDQTQHTLNFALRAKNIKNKPILNEVLSDSALIKRYLKQIAKLSQELELMKQKTGMNEVEEMSHKLKEKEELNQLLNERIGRLKEALIVSSSSPVRKKAKTISRGKRRHSWSGQGDRRMSFQTSCGPGLSTITEHSPSSVSPPQANSTRLDETVCPFEKFELELLKGNRSDWTEICEDENKTSLAEELGAASIKNFSSNMTLVPDSTIFSDDKSVELTLIDNDAVIFKEAGTPPFVLRQRINNMSSHMESVLKEYEELREYTTLEKQILGEDMVKYVQEVKKENSSLHSKLKVTEEKLEETEEKLEETKASFENLMKLNIELKENIEHIKKENSEQDLVKNLEELKEENIKLKQELESKAVGFDELKKYCDEINANFERVSKEKSELENEIKTLLRKVTILETKNSDLEAVLEHKKKKSIERETELENELKEAWKSLEDKEKLLLNGPMDEQAVVELKKLKISENEPDNESAVADLTMPAPPDADLTMPVPSDEKELSIAPLEFIACDSTFTGDMSLISSPVDAVDPLQSSIFLNDSLIPIQIPCTPENTTVSDKDELHNKILIDNLQKELETERNKSSTMLHNLDRLKDILSFSSDRRLLDTEIEEEVMSLKMKSESLINTCNETVSKLRVEIDKLQAKVDCNNECEQILNGLNNILCEVFPNFSRDKMMEGVSQLITYKVRYDELNLANSELVKFENKIMQLMVTLCDGGNVTKDQVESVIVNLKKNNSDLENQLNETKNHLSGVQKDYTDTINELKKEVEESEQCKFVLRNACETLSEECTDSLTNVNFKETILKLVYNLKEIEKAKQVAERCNENEEVIAQLRSTLASQEEMNKENSLIISDLCSVFNEVEDSESVDANNLKHYVQELKRKCLEFKTQLDELIVSTNNNDEKFKELENKLEESTHYKNVLNDVVKVLFSEDTVDDCSIPQEKVVECVLEMKNLTSSLELNRQEFECKLSSLSQIENELKMEIERLNNKVEEGNMLEGVINNIYNVLKDCKEDNSTVKLNEKAYFVDNCIVELKTCFDNLEIEHRQILSANKSEIEELKLKQEELSHYEQAFKEICLILNSNRDNSINSIVEEILHLKNQLVEMKIKVNDYECFVGKENEWKAEVNTLKKKLEENSFYEEELKKIGFLFQDSINDSIITSGGVKEKVLLMQDQIKYLQNKIENEMMSKIEHSEAEKELLTKIEELQVKLNEAISCESIVDGICSIVQDENNLCTKNNVHDMILSLTKQIEELKRTGHETEKVLLETSKCQDIVERICCLFQNNENENITVDELISRIVFMKNENIVLRDRTSEMEQQSETLKCLSQKVDECTVNETFFNKICTLLKEDENDTLVSKEDVESKIEFLKNRTVELANGLSEAIDAKERSIDAANKLHCQLEEAATSKVMVTLQLGELQAKNDEFIKVESQMKTEIVELKNKIENFLSYKETFEYLCNILQGETKLELSKDDLKEKAESLVKQVIELKDCLNRAECETVDLKKENEKTFNELLEIVEVNDKREEFSNIKDAVILLKQDNIALKEKISNFENSAVEYEALKEKLETYVECVDIVFNLCNMLSKKMEKAVSKCDIQSTVDSILMENARLLDDLDERDSLQDENGSMNKKIENLEKNLQECEAVLTKICEVFNIDFREESIKDKLLQLITDLKNESQNLISEKADLERAYKDLDIQYKGNQGALEEALLSSKECMKVIREVYEVIENETGEIVDSDAQNNSLKGHFVHLYNNFNALKAVNSEMDLKCNSLTNEFELMLKTLEAIIGVIGDNVTVDTVLNSIQLLKTNETNLKKEANEWKIKFDEISTVHSELTCLIEDNTNILKTDNDMLNSDSKYKIVEAITILFKKLQESKSIAEEFANCKSENQDLLNQLVDYKEHIDMFNKLCDILQPSLTECSSKSVICDTVAALVEKNAGFNKRLVEINEANEKIINDLNTAYFEMNSKFIVSEENENLISKITELLFPQNEEDKDKILEAVSSFKTENSELKMKIELLVSESEAVKKETIKNTNLLHSELETFKEIVSEISEALGIANEKSVVRDTVMGLKSENSELKMKIEVLVSEKESVKKELSENFNLLQSELDTHKGILSEITTVLGVNNEKSVVQNAVICMITANSDLKMKIDVLVSEKESANKEHSENTSLLQSELNTFKEFLSHITKVLGVTNEKAAVQDAILSLKSDNEDLLKQLNNITETTDKIVELKTAVDVLKTKLTETTLAVQEKENNENILQTEITRYKTEAIHLLSDSENKNKIISKLENELELHKRLLDESAITIKENGKIIEQLKSDLEKQNDTCSKFSSESEENKVKINNLEEEIKKLKATKTETVDNESVAESGKEAHMLEKALEENRNVKFQLEKCLLIESDIKKNLANEINNLKPGFKLDTKNISSLELLHSFISVIMEKQMEVVSVLKDEFKSKESKFTEMINQLKGDEKKMKQWTEHLENDIENLNQELSLKNKEITGIREETNKREIEIKNLTEEMCCTKQKLSVAEAETASLLVEVKKNNIKGTSCEEANAKTELLSDELQEKEMKIVFLTSELNEKMHEVSQLKFLMESKHLEWQKSSSELLEQYEGQKKMLRDELENEKEMHASEISDLRISLENKTADYNTLMDSLNSLKKDYQTIKQSLESNTKGNMIAQSKLDEITKDLEGTKAIVCHLVDALQAEEKNKQDERSALLKMSEEKVKVCQDLETRLHLLTAEHEKIISTHTERISKLEKTITIKDKELEEKKVLLNSKVKECKEKDELVLDKQKANKDMQNQLAVVGQELAEQSKAVTKLQSDIIIKDEEIATLQKVHGELKSLQKIKVELNNKEKIHKDLEKQVSDLENKLAEQSRTITKLQSNVICKEQEVQKFKDQVKRLDKVEEELKADRHQLKKLKLKTGSLTCRSEDFDQKENDLALLLNSSNNTNAQINDNVIYSEKLKKFEKALFSVFDVPPKTLEVALDNIKKLIKRVEELEKQLSESEEDKKELDLECDAMNSHIQSLEKDISNHLRKELELNEDFAKVKEEYSKELVTCTDLRKHNAQLNKDLDSLRIEFDRCEQMVKDLRKEKRHLSFRDSEKNQADTSSSGLPSTPNTDFRSIKHRWEQMSTSAQKQQPAQNKECQCEELLKRNQELKVELADKNSKLTMLQIQIQGENFPYKKKAAALEEALTESKTKIMSLKQEVRRLQTCLHEVTVFQGCDACRTSNSKRSTADISIQADVTEAEGVSSGSEIVQKQSMNLLRERISKMERESLLLKRLCRERNKKIEQLQIELKSASGQK